MREGCGFWIELGVEPLVQALREATRLERAELLRLGARGRDWMQRDFSWGRVARDMADVYRWLRAGGTAPACVRTS